MPRLVRLDARPSCLPRPVPGWDREGVADGGQATGVFHHVIIRGIERRKMFRNKKDRADFLERLADICKADELVRMWRTLVL